VITIFAGLGPLFRI